MNLIARKEETRAAHRTTAEKKKQWRKLNKFHEKTIARLMAVDDFTKLTNDHVVKFGQS